MSVCLSVCLSACLAASRKTTDLIMIKILPKMCFWIKKKSYKNGIAPGRRNASRTVKESFRPSGGGAHCHLHASVNDRRFPPIGETASSCYCIKAVHSCTECKSYYPIHLLSVPGKVFEDVLLARLGHCETAPDDLNSLISHAAPVASLGEAWGADRPG